MASLIQKLTGLTSEAFHNQTGQFKQWINGDAITGASDAIKALRLSFDIPKVKKKDWQYMIPNLLVLFLMSVAFLLFHGIIVLSCHLISLTGWTNISPPTLYSTIGVAIWVQIGLWSTLLSNIFYSSAEDCFYARLGQVDHHGLLEVHRREENWSFVLRTWSSFKRTVRSYRWLLILYILKLMPKAWLLVIPARIYFLLSAAKNQPLPILLSLFLISFMDSAKVIFEFSTLVKNSMREIPLMYRLENTQQRKVVKQLWGSAYAFGFSAVLTVFLVIPAPCLLWFHIAAAYADLASHKNLELSKVIEN